MKVIEMTILMGNRQFNSTCILEYDDNKKIYTVYHQLIPQIYCEGKTELEVIERFEDEIKAFLMD